MPVDDNFLVHHAINSLSIKFNVLKTSHNTQKGTWDINSLISFCAQEEERMQRDVVGSVCLVNQPPQKKFSKKKFFKGNKNFAYKLGQTHNTQVAQAPPGPKPFFKREGKKCWHCQKVGHMKVNCYEFKSLLENKNKTGNYHAFVCSESSLIDVPVNSW